MSIINLPEQDIDKYRNELTSIAIDGSRKWIYARQPKGNYYTARTIVIILLLGFLFLAPHITVHGHQFILINILKREFIVFGYPFMPQDFHLVVVLALTSIVSIALFTAILGRIWCGWMCPQTIFMEMIFRRLEWMILFGIGTSFSLLFAGYITSILPIHFKKSIKKAMPLATITIAILLIIESVTLGISYKPNSTFYYQYDKNHTGQNSIQVPEHQSCCVPDNSRNSK